MKRLWIIRAILFISDVVLLEGIYFTTYYIRFKTGLFINSVDFSLLEIVFPSLIVTGYWILILTWFGLYRIDPLKARSEIAVYTVKTVTFGILLLFIVTFDPTNPVSASRVILAVYGISIYAVITGNRIALQTILRNLRIKGYLGWNTLIIGVGQKAIDLYNYFNRHPELGTKITGAIHSGSHQIPNPFVKIVGNFSDLREIIYTHNYHAVVMAVESEEERYLNKLARLLQNSECRIFIREDQYRLLLGEVKPIAVKGYPLIEIRPDLLSNPELFFKRIFDIISSLFLLLFSLPLWVLLIVAIPLDSKGGVFYLQKRVGLQGKEFSMIKFRSMIKDAENFTGAVMVSVGDRRVTAVGRIIRPLRFDELPQLLNVLLGQMSLVGPRPERPSFVKQFIEEIPLYERRLNVKPGLTGWSQVHVKNPNDPDVASLKLKYDFFYIENMSLPLDLKIMFMTLFVILRGQGQ